MSSLSKQIKAYIREISRNLPRNYPNKNEFLYTLERNVRNYAEEHPAADWAEIIEQFGDASTVAEAFLRELQDEEFAHIFQIKRRNMFIAAVICFLLCILLAGAVCIFQLWLNEDKFMMEETLYIFEGTEVPEKWYDDYF